MPLYGIFSSDSGALLTAFVKFPARLNCLHCCSPCVGEKFQTVGLGLMTIRQDRAGASTGGKWTQVASILAQRDEISLPKSGELPRIQKGGGEGEFGVGRINALRRDTANIRHLLVRPEDPSLNNETNMGTRY